MKTYSNKVIKYIYSKYNGNIKQKPVNKNKRELYENMYLNLSVEANQEINSEYAGWTNKGLLLQINGLLAFLKCICFTPEEINHLSLNID